MKKTPIIYFNKWRIREACEIRGMNTSDIARSMGVSRVTIYAWLRDGLDNDDAIRMVDILGYSISDLCDMLPTK